MAKRRPSGDGMVRKREDGRWEGRIVVGHKKNGTPIFQHAYAHTQKELTEKLHQNIERYQDVELTEDSRMTLGEWLDRWLADYKENTVRPGTLAGYRSCIENYIKPRLGGKQVSLVTSQDVQKLYRRLKENGRVREHPRFGSALSDTTINRLHAIFHQAMEDALHAHIIAKNPTVGATVPKASHAPKRVLTDKELDTFLDAVREDKIWGDFFYVELTTGLRRGEICGLMWRDFDARNGVLQVRRTLHDRKLGVDLEYDANQDNRLFNFLLFLFPYYLKTAMRKGLFKKYIRHQYNDGNVKGTIDIARHLAKNTPFTGNIAYNQREFSYDNSLTELVRHTIEFIKGKPYGNKLLIKVKDEVRLVIEATPGYESYDRQRIIEQNKKNTVRHAYFREYLALQRLCLLILRHQKHQVGSGSKQIYGILFDGAWLWEEYINSLIEDVFYHPMNKGGKGAQRLFDGNIGLIYPDFISRNHEVRIIADAKYKPIDNIGNRDYLQVLAYMFRFDAKAGYYLYPEVEGSDDLRLWMNCGSTYEANVTPRDDVSVTKHGLKIPVDALNYAEFSVRMKTCEQEFKSALIF